MNYYLTNLNHFLGGDLQVSIFQECQPEFLHDLVLKMRASIFTPGDMICRRGEVAREMFIIADGVLEVIRFQHFCSFNVSGTGEPQSPLGGTCVVLFYHSLELECQWTNNPRSRRRELVAAPQICWFGNFDLPRRAKWRICGTRSWWHLKLIWMNSDCSLADLLSRVLYSIINLSRALWVL